MKLRGSFVIFLCLFIPFISLLGQKDSTQNNKLNINGYLSNLQTAMFDSINQKWSIENILHNRINGKVYFSDVWKGAFEMRNRFFYSQDMNASALQASGSDRGLANLTWNLAQGKSYILSSNIDRFWLSYEKGAVSVTLGRQRINWGQTFVWNPNDIFNSYSFFDFDYEEKPGSDAVRVQYYTSEVSSSEVAIKMNHEHKITLAGLYKFNRSNFDIQFLTGVLDSKDFVLGTGWSGDVGDMAFRGEMSYFQPMKHSSDTLGFWMVSLGVDYLFTNSLSFQAEALVNNRKRPEGFSFIEIYSAPLNVKNLAFTRYNLFAQISYPVKELFQASLSGMYFPELRGFYAGPGLTYSLSNNVDFSFRMQVFSAELNHVRQNLDIAYLRLKINF
jgi:hypothetical protein